MHFFSKNVCLNLCGDKKGFTNLWQNIYMAFCKAFTFTEQKVLDDSVSQFTLMRVIVILPLPGKKSQRDLMNSTKPGDIGDCATQK